MTIVQLRTQIWFHCPIVLWSAPKDKCDQKHHALSITTLTIICMQVEMMEADLNKRRGLFLSIECINTLNEGLLLHHASMGCPKPQWSKYLSFLKSKRFSELTKPKYLNRKKPSSQISEHRIISIESRNVYPKIHTLFSTECSSYFDWQTVGLVHSFHLSGQPGNITRLLSCTDEVLKQYKGHNLAPTHYVPSMSQHPLTGDWYVILTD